MQTHHRANQRKIIEHVTANRRMLRRTRSAQRTRFRRCRNHSNRAAAHATGPKLQITVEPIVQFAPSCLRHELIDTGVRPSRQRRGKKRREVFRCRR